MEMSSMLCLRRSSPPWKPKTANLRELYLYNHQRGSRVALLQQNFYPADGINKGTIHWSAQMLEPCLVAHSITVEIRGIAISLH